MAKQEFNTTLVTGASLGADYTSSTIATDRNDLIGLQLIIGGTPVGTFELQVTIDGSNWSTITNSDVDISAAGDIFYSIANITYPKLRIFYDSTSSTGTLAVSLYKRETN